MASDTEHVKLKLLFPAMTIKDRCWTSVFGPRADSSWIFENLVLADPYAAFLSCDVTVASIFERVDVGGGLFVLSWFVARVVVSVYKL